jgi:hypothetical protein
MVAILIHIAAHIRVAIIIARYTLGSVIRLGSMIHFLIVLTTSQPAIRAQLASNIAAITIAQPSVRAFDPTAGHMLFATSFAPIFMAIYIQKREAIIRSTEFSPLIFNWKKYT